jgi:hypothetical protein
MTGETDLTVLLRSMTPVVRPGEYVFVSSPGEAPAGLSVHASVRESEGLTIVVDRADADRLGLAYDFVAAWITLEVHSALEAVGLTAAFSTALTDIGVSCNVIAGYFHDHILVDVSDVGAALEAQRRHAQT